MYLATAKMPPTAGSEPNAMRVKLILTFEDEDDLSKHNLLKRPLAFKCCNGNRDLLVADAIAGAVVVPPTNMDENAFVRLLNYHATIIADLFSVGQRTHVVTS